MKGRNRFRFTEFRGRTWPRRPACPEVKAFVGVAVFAVALAFARTTNAQTAPLPAGTPATTSSPTSQPIVPGSLGVPAPGVSPSPPSATPAATSPPTPGSAERTATPLPAPSGSPAQRTRLQRPGSDIEGDVLSGNTANDVFVVRGNVTLHSDPKVDKEFAASESDDPITVTADEIDVDKFAMTYTAKGHVHFVQGDRSGSADVALLNEQTHDLDLLGNADVLQGEHRARAAKMHYNTADRRFRGAGDVRIYEPLPTPGPHASSTPPPKRKRRLPI